MPIEPDLAARSLGQAVRRRRKQLRLSQAEAAQLAGCSRLFVSQLEAGKPSVRLDLVRALLAALGLGFRVVASPVSLEVEPALASD